MYLLLGSSNTLHLQWVYGENAERPRLQRRIDFGCEVQFTKISELVDEGLRAQDKQFEKGMKGSGSTIAWYDTVWTLVLVIHCAT